MNHQINSVYEFGPFRLVPSERLLFRGGEPVALKPKAFDTLVILVEHGGHIMKKDDLIKLVWPDAFVEESNLNHHISILRKALNNGGDGDGYIETIRRHGFRFAADVRHIVSDDLEMIWRRRTHSQVRITQEVQEHQSRTIGTSRSLSWRKVALGMFGATALLALSGFAVLRLVSSHRSAEANPHASRHIPNPGAYEAYVNGRASWSKRTDEGYKQATEYFKQAVELDPNFARGYAGLADCYLLYGNVLEQKSPYEFHEVLKKALDLDNSLAEAHATLAYYKGAVEWDWTGAEREFQRAISLDPNYATAHHWHAYNLISMGNIQEAINEITRAQELDPTSLIINTDAGHIFYLARRNDLAFAALRKALRIDPNFGLAHVHLGEVYAREGRYDEAVAELQLGEKLLGGASEVPMRLGYVYAKAGKQDEARKRLDDYDKSNRRTAYPQVFGQALIYAALGDQNQAFKLLSEACERREGSMALFKVDPMLDDLRADARYADLLRRIGLAS
jgi:DNA-binding winged helix-turn-helix (wHTH) protein/tetratricopeptide (TPR) repeat protein